MPPLADAVGLVHHQKADGAPLHEVPEPAVQRFRRQVHQLVLAPAEGGEASLPLLRIQGGVDLHRPEPQLPEGVDLVLHETDEGREDQHRTLQDAGRKLVGQGLSRPGGHHRDAVASGEDRVDDLFLARAEGVEAEDVAEDGVGGGEGLHGCQGNRSGRGGGMSRQARAQEEGNEGTMAGSVPRPSGHGRPPAFARPTDPSHPSGSVAPVCVRCARCSLRPLCRCATCLRCARLCPVPPLAPSPPPVSAAAVSAPAHPCMRTSHIDIDSFWAADFGEAGTGS